MSLKILKSEIARFLSVSKPEVLSLRGDWGTGKTYGWKKFIREFSQHNSLPTKRYTYVSLFGVNSLQEFKFLLFQQSVQNSMIGQEASLTSFRTNAVDFSESLGRKSFTLLERLPFLKDFSSELRSLTFLSMTDTLICIDDLERKGNKLEIKDILGLISQLKEEKQCKIVLILNDGALEDQELKEFEKYREKVIDVELLFDPTVEECAEIAFEEQEIDNRLKPRILKLGIKNIRIIFRIKRLINLVLPHLGDFESEVSDQAVHSLCLLTWCYLADDKVSPNYQYVTKIGYRLMGVEDNDTSDAEKIWNGILQDYEFLFLDEFDLVLARVVERGYVIEDELIDVASTLNKQIQANKGDKSLEEAWRLYHDSFEDNQEEVIKTIFECFKANTKYVSPLNLNGTVSLLRELGRDDLADNCITHYVETRINDKKLFNLDDYAFAGDINDPKIIEEFNKVHVSLSLEKTLSETVADIAGKNGWGRKDIDVMANATEDDYYKLFKSEHGRHLHSYVNACLQFKRISNTSEKERSISEKAEAALRHIASESAINKRRVASYGIRIDKAVQR